MKPKQPIFVFMVMCTEFCACTTGLIGGCVFRYVFMYAFILLRLDLCYLFLKKRFWPKYRRS